MKIIGKLILWIVAIVLILAISKNVIAQVAVSAGVKAMTGTDLNIGKLDLGIMSGKVHIQNLHLSNPKGFEEKTMVDLPEILVAADLPAIIKGKIHMKDILIHLKEFHVIKNKDGALNLDAFKVVSATKQGETPAEVKKETKPIDLQIDHLGLKIEKVTFTDHSVMGQTVKKDFNVNINEEFTNITDPNELVSIILVKALRNTTIGQLTNLNLGAISDVGSQALASGKQLAADVEMQAKQMLDSSVDKLNLEAMSAKSGEVASQTTESVKEAAESVKGVAGSLFGSVKEKVSN